MDSRLLALATVLCVFGTLPQDRGKPASKPRDRNEARSEYELLREKIVEEIKTLKDHEWAATYYCGDGMGFNFSVAVAPKSGFVYAWTGCMGLYSTEHGACSEIAGREPRLRFDRAPTSDVPGPLRSVMHVVKWGRRRYLVGDSDMIGFCNWVNSPSAFLFVGGGPFLVSSEDRTSGRPSGLPAVPAAYRKYLLAAPIVGSLTSVEEPEITQQGPLSVLSSRVVIDRGAADGVWGGMEFTFAEDSSLEKISVEEVAEHSCVARFERIFSGEKRPDPPRPGRKVTTGSAVQSSSSPASKPASPSSRPRRRE